MVCKEKHPKCLHFRCFQFILRTFLVEISGIEPLTS